MAESKRGLAILLQLLFLTPVTFSKASSVARTRHRGIVAEVGPFQQWNGQIVPGSAVE